MMNFLTESLNEPIDGDFLITPVINTIVINTIVRCLGDDAWADCSFVKRTVN